MTDEHNTENKQRLLDRQMETAIWPDEYLEKTASANKPNLSGLHRSGSAVSGNGESTQKSTFAHLGGKCILPAPEKVAARSAKPVDLSAAYGATGRRGGVATEAEKSKDEEVGTD